LQERDDDGEKLMVKVGDFGLARYRPNTTTHPMSPTVEGNLFTFSRCYIEAEILRNNLNQNLDVLIKKH